MNSKEYHVNKLVMKFISSCMKIRDSLLEMQQMFFSSFLVLFVLYFDCHMHAFAIMYNDAVMEIKQSFTITITTTTTTTTTTATTITTTTTTTATTTTTTTTFVKRARPPGIVYYWILILKLKSKLILTAGRVMEEIQKENKSEVMPDILVCNTNLQRGIQKGNEVHHFIFVVFPYFSITLAAVKISLLF